MLAEIIFAACALVMVTVVIHSLGFALLLRRMLRPDAPQLKNLRQITRNLIALAWWLILIHSLEIVIWGWFLWWRGCLPSAETAFYFSGVTYTTVGYGDVLLLPPWRILAPVEALTGILMCGLSTGLFFAHIHRLIIGWVSDHPVNPGSSSGGK